MPNHFGRSSSKKLDTCVFELAEVCARALEFSPYDFTIVHGWRGQEAQDALFASRASQKPWPKSKHNKVESRVGEADLPQSEAIDFAPWVNGKIPWDDTHVFAIIAGCFFSAAKDLGVTIRYGGDWDTDGSTKDQTLMDWGHIEVLL